MLRTLAVYCIALTVTILFTMTLSGCGPDPQERMDTLQQKTSALAASLNEDFVALREMAVKYANVIGGMVDSGKRYPDAPANEYVWFQDDFYYTDPHLKRDHTVAFLNGFYLPEGSGVPIPENYDKAQRIAPGAPEMQRIKAHMAIYEAVWPQVKADFEARFAPGTWYFFSVFPQDWLMMYSFPVDVASVLPRGLDLPTVSQAFWMRGVLPETNPHQKPYWKPYVWIGQAGEGLLMGVSAPYKAERDVDYLCVDNTFFLNPYIENKLSGVEGNIVVLDAMTTVVDSTGEQLFKTLPEFDYLEQLRKNPTYGKEFRLPHESQSTDMQTLGKAILDGKNRFEHSINDTTYLVVVSPVPEVNFYVVGLVEK